MYNNHWVWYIIVYKIVGQKKVLEKQNQKVLFSYNNRLLVIGDASLEVVGFIHVYSPLLVGDGLCVCVRERKGGKERKRKGRYW